MNPDYYPWIVLAVVCLVARGVYWYRWKQQCSRGDAETQGWLPDIPMNMPMPPVKAPLLPKHRTGPGGDTDQAVDKLLQHLDGDDKERIG